MTPEEEYRALRPIPSVRYIATGKEEVKKIRPDKLKKKKNQFKNRFDSNSSSDEEEKKSDEEEEENEDEKFIKDKPREKVKL